MHKSEIMGAVTPGMLAAHEAHLARRARLSAPIAPRRQIVVPPTPALFDHGVPINMLARPNWRFLTKLCAVRHDVTVEAIMGQSRSVPIVAAWLIHCHCPAFSIPEIGRLFNRDHTSVLHAISKFTGARRRTDVLPNHQKGDA